MLIAIAVDDDDDGYDDSNSDSELCLGAIRMRIFWHQITQLHNQNVCHTMEDSDFDFTMSVNACERANVHACACVSLCTYIHFCISGVFGAGRIYSAFY